jgi:hypothetical protein
MYRGRSAAGLEVSRVTIDMQTISNRKGGPAAHGEPQRNARANGTVSDESAVSLPKARCKRMWLSWRSVTGAGSGHPPPMSEIPIRRSR